MANILKMATVQAIQRLFEAHWPQRRIARELGIDRGTVARYLQSLPADPNAAIPPAGPADSNAATLHGPPAPPEQGSDRSEGADSNGGSKPAIPPTGSGSSKRAKKEAAKAH